jgi:long-chain acyl-CoA synthetase
MTHIGSIEPHLFIGVPRFYEKLYAGMIEKINQGSAWQQALVAWSLRVGESYTDVLRSGKRPNRLRRLYHGLADLLVLQRLRSVMGANLRYMVSGSAPMPLWLLERFHTMGLLVLEAYGMSENAIPVAANRLDAYRFGTVGRPMSGCEVRLANDGELMVRGPGVISSYYGEEQAGLLDADGYLASGDYATIDADGFITLIGRKSEIIKTATGRRIAPAGIESFLLKVPTVESAAVFGAGRPFLVAVVVVPTEALSLMVGENTGKSSLMAYCEWICPEFAKYLAPLPDYKRPAGLVVTTRPFTSEGGELTINLKLRRRNIAKCYAGELETLYRRLEQTKGGAMLEAADTKKGEIVLCSL